MLLNNKQTNNTLRRKLSSGPDQAGMLSSELWISRRELLRLDGKEGGLSGRIRGEGMYRTDTGNSGGGWIDSWAWNKTSSMPGSREFCHRVVDSQIFSHGTIYFNYTYQQVKEHQERQGRKTSWGSVLILDCGAGTTGMEIVQMKKKRESIVSCKAEEQTAVEVDRLTICVHYAEQCGASWFRRERCRRLCVRM